MSFANMEGMQTPYWMGDAAGCCLKRLEAVTERSKAKILGGGVDKVVNALVKILREEKKVI